jgi:hypothetical protein
LPPQHYVSFFSPNHQQKKKGKEKEKKKRKAKYHTNTKEKLTFQEPQACQLHNRSKRSEQVVDIPLEEDEARLQRVPAPLSIAWRDFR